ncbi:hypothetical protein AU189_22025 [Mycolicibacterium acapulense]|nr:hypothetical protein AU189_22025 [Mycolicibacterium acapulense]
MTGPEDDHSNTRPISVAELLARNGTIGAPPVGGRRRRRRGADSVTVAELTGEIPIIRDDDAPATGRSAAATVEAPTEAEPDAVAAEAAPETAEAVTTNGAVDHAEETEAEPAAGEGVEEEALEVPEDEPLEVTDAETSEVEAVEDEADEAAGADVDTDYADAVSDYQTHIEQRDADEDLDFFAPPRRSTFARRRFGMLGRSAQAEPSDAQVGAEEMSPDPVDWADPEADEDEATDAAVAVAEPEHDDERDDRPSYLRSPDNALFGGPDVDDDDVARRKNGLSPADVDLDEEEDAPRSGAMSSFLRGAMVVGQCVVAVAFGAGLFIAFDQLWKWNSIVALVLGVLVILGLVVGVRVVRKTEDIGSTLIAVAVGAMVTFGPLALMQAA